MAVSVIYGIKIDSGLPILKSFINDGTNVIYSVDDKQLNILGLTSEKVLIGVKVCPEIDKPGMFPMESLLYSSLDYEYIVNDIITQNNKLKELFYSTSSTPAYWILHL